MKTFVKAFASAFAESIVIRGIIAIMLLSVVCYQAATNVPIDSNVLSLATLVLGFYFGSVQSQAKNKSETKQ
jgi:hypothetical protein